MGSLMYIFCVFAFLYFLGKISKDLLSAVITIILILWLASFIF